MKARYRQDPKGPLRGYLYGLKDQAEKEEIKGWIILNAETGRWHIFLMRR